MTEHDMKQLAESAKHMYSDLECIFAERVLLPFRQFSPEILVIKNAGPRELDAIFFDLLKLGVNTRKEVARRLGIDIDEFIFAHLDILIREGYVNESAGKLTLTEKGKRFDTGTALEERIERLPKGEFSFVWGDMTSRIEPDVKFAKGASKEFEIKHGEHPGEENLTVAMAEYFNKMNKDKKFYDVATRDFGRKFPEERKHAEYAALFYALKDSKDNLSRVDLRMHDSDAPTLFVPCEELSKHAAEEPWLGQFEEIWKKRIGG